MDNNKRFFVKLLGIFMIEITNVTPEKIIKILWVVAKIEFIAILLIKMPEYINAIKWW